MNQLSLFKPITTFIFDVDGVMTDGSVQLLDNGELARTMSTRDGYAVSHARDKGYQIAVISGGSSPNVKKRLQGLGVTDIYLGISNKKEKMEDYLLMNAVSKDKVLYMGDDMPDYEVLQLSGLPCCPANAADEIKKICQYISPFKGGKGCVRDVIEKVMKLNSHW